MATLAGWVNHYERATFHHLDRETLTRTLDLLKPDDLFPAWKYIDPL